MGFRILIHSVLHFILIKVILPKACKVYMRVKQIYTTFQTFQGQRRAALFKDDTEDIFLLAKWFILVPKEGVLSFW